MYETVQVTAEMSDAIANVWTGLVVRAGGPLSFRFILQPAMAALLGIRDGIGLGEVGWRKGQ